MKIIEGDFATPKGRFVIVAGRFEGGTARLPRRVGALAQLAAAGYPVGLTIAGRAYDDTALLRLGLAFERLGTRRTRPPRTPALPRTTSENR